ncbi:DUF1064 domain-containing protein [Muribaculum intestinale]|uniref:DUF1064 domain-containing protein n=1 Tax=Muribaculum intestinale TaxID=1796646 RepID=UPI0025B793D1|nr:DUF1064 domain-containing protein [Muribaculum intestinale]
MKQETLTVEQFRALAEKQKSGSGSSACRFATAKKKKSKYHAEKCNGYDSKKEYYRAQQLKLWLKAGVISELREQVVFLLIPSQINSEGIEEKPVRYKADFVYIDNATGQMVVEDTKGFRTPEYIIKRKLMLQVHGITIKEI